jgi:gliding motility-associated-like protein
MTNDTLCHGETGYATVTVNGNNSYEYLWSNNTTSDSLIVNVGNTYTITITDMVTKCSIEDDVEIPGYDLINAFFTTNNTPGCIPSYESELDFIDISQGGKNGTWYFGDGTTTPYHFLENPSHLYTDTGEYMIELIIFNEGGCSDTFSREICIIPKSILYIPNAFTPNNDGINDEFKPIISDVSPIELRIYNRWGKELFKTNDPNKGWDGNYDGKKAMGGTYVYKLKYELLDQPSNKAHIERGTFILLRNDSGN